MKCKNVRRLLSPYLDGELAGRAQVAVAAHLASCPACDSEVRAMKAAADALAEVRVPQVSPFLATRVMAEVRATGRAALRRPVFVLSRALVTAAAALVVVAGVGAGAALGTSIALATKTQTTAEDQLGLTQTASATMDVFEPVLGSD